MSPWLAAVLAAIPALGGGAGYAQMRRTRSQNRVDNANAENTEADAVKTWQGLYGDLQGRVQQMELQMTALLEKDRSRELEMSSLRDDARAAAADAADARLEAQRARTEKAKADTRVAELEADLAKALKQAGDERHALRNEFAAYRLEQEQREITLRDHYETQLELLRGEIATLKARLGDDRRSAERRVEDEARAAGQDTRQHRQDERQTAQDAREDRQNKTDQPPA